MTPFSITPEPRDHALALVVRGELDLATVPELRAALDDALGRGAARCVVDLSECEFMDSSGSRTLVVAGEAFEAAGSTLTVHCPPENRRVRSLIELVGLPHVLTVTPSGADDA